MTPFADCYASSWESEKLCWDTVELYEEMAVACGHNESWLGIEDFGPLTLVCGSSGVARCITSIKTKFKKYSLSVFCFYELCNSYNSIIS